MSGDNVTDVECNIIYPISHEIELAMTKVKLTSGELVFRDLGAEYDNFSTSFTIETDELNGSVFEERLKYPDSLSFTLYDGMYPFTPIFDYSVVSGGVNFVVNKVGTDTMIDDFGYINQYDLDIYPAYNNIYDTFPLLSGAEDYECTNTGWTLQDITLPFPESKFNLNKNEVQNGLQLHNNYSCVDRPYRALFEETTLSVKLDTEGVRRLLNMLLTYRAYEMVMSVPPVFIPFGQQYKDNAIFNVILSNNKITIDHRNFNEFLVTISLQLKEVVI